MSAVRRLRQRYADASALALDERAARWGPLAKKYADAIDAELDKIDGKLLNVNKFIVDLPAIEGAPGVMDFPVTLADQIQYEMDARGGHEYMNQVRVMFYPIASKAKLEISCIEDAPDDEAVSDE